MKERIRTVIFILVFIAGAGVFFYPAISTWWNSMAQSRRVAVYNNIVHASELDSSVAEQKERAETWNRDLYESGSFHIGDYEHTNPDPAYESELSLTDDGMMGYIQIKKIGETIPIYHYAADDVLDKGIGHLPGTSLPVGGDNTNCVLSGHRGLPKAKLFSDLDKMKIGDKFTVACLDEIHTYKVDDISVVLPEDVGSIKITPGKDYVTLVTCTPYGVNTHRLLVRGERITDTGADNRSAGVGGSWMAAEGPEVPVLILLIAMAAAALIRKILKR